MVFNEYIIVGKYQISDMCLHIYPCQHYVTNIETGESSRMRGDKIYCLLRDEGLSHTHFNGYAEYLRRLYNPTPEELAEANENRRISDLMEKERKKKQEEHELLTNTYKASSRLERLKAKNNITENVVA